MLDAWLSPLKALVLKHKLELEKLSDNSQAIRLAELNVVAGLECLQANYVVAEAIEKRGLKVHGAIYDIGHGRLREVGEGQESHGRMNEEVVRGKHGMLVFGDEGADMSVA